MSQRAYDVTAIWDEEAGCFVSDSNIIGLHIEATTLPEFKELVREYAAELIVANHLTDADIAGTPLRDLIPAIVIHGTGSIRAAE